MAVSRRVVLTALTGATLTGCQASPGTAPGPARPPGGAAPVASARVAAVRRTAAGPTLPSRARTVARYAGVEPHAWGMSVPGVTTGLPGGRELLALTFDACGGPGGSGYDAGLIGFLRATRVPATLFLNARWIAANPARFGQLAADPLFEIANHGTAHRPLSVTGRAAYGITGTRDAGEVYDEVEGTATGLTRLLGHRPRFFRSGTAHYDDVATRIVADLGHRVAGFTVNGDAGATLTAAQVRAQVESAPPGAIVIAHMNHPGHGTADGIAAAVPPLLASGRRFVRLSDVLK
ncbi:polysaccharide deacetylase family protein [Streptacidiphilus sp. 4-A2]|nr:polysaccharide deacetylase family protein [Streptacidiphilus sp. 4-A2]